MHAFVCVWGWGVAGGRTKRKLSHVCGAELNIEERNGRTVLEMRGTEDTIKRAKLYVGFVMQQRVGPVQLPPDAESRDDLTIIDVSITQLHACMHTFRCMHACT